MAQKIARYAQLSDTILRDTEKSGESLLLPGHELARRYGVSYRTLRRAIDLLKERNLVAGSPGGRLRLRHSTENDNSPHTPVIGESASALFKTIHADIESGVYRADQPLPKIGYFTVTHHVCHETARSAMRELERKGLVYRIGRRWFAGKKASSRTTIPSSGAAISSDSPVVVLLLPYLRMWYGWTTISYAKSFFIEFKKTVEQNGITTSTVAVNPLKSGAPIPAGANSICRYIESLGSRYYGTIAVWGPNPRNPERFYHFLTRLLRYEKPVVWYRHNEPPRRSAGYVAAIRKRAGRLRELFYCCYHDENRGIGCAVEKLASLGHRQVGILYPQHVPWVQRRRAILRRECRRYGISLHFAPDLLLRRSTQLQEQVGWKDLEDILGKIGTLTGSSALPHKASPARRRELLSANPALASLIIDRKSTALIALNDYFAQDLYGWVLMCGLSIPKDISLISFDNRVETNIYPISTIDFGFDRLGYCAGQLFVKSVPIRTGRDNMVTTEPFICDRGSLGVRAGASATRCIRPAVR